jgi:hypothetical protein
MVAISAFGSRCDQGVLRVLTAMMWLVPVERVPEGAWRVTIDGITRYAD